ARAAGHRALHSFPTRRSSDLVVVLAATIATLLLAAGIAFHLSGTVTRPLRQAILLARGIAGGDLTQEIRVDRRDEAGEMLLALRSEEHTSELQSRENLVCRLL